MKTIQPAPRLQWVAYLGAQQKKNGWLVDVGTDHAYLPAWLLQEHREQFAYIIATDLRRGPLDRARQTAREAGCGEDIDFRLCDGLAVVDPEERLLGPGLVAGRWPDGGQGAGPSAHVLHAGAAGLAPEERFPN